MNVPFLCVFVGAVLHTTESGQLNGDGTKGE